MTKVGVQFGGTNEFEKSLRSFEDRASASVKQRAAIAAFQVEGIAKKSIAKTSQGKTSTRYLAGGKRSVTISAPGEPPNTDTGKLISSIRTRFSKNGLIAFVFTNLNYAFWLEFGTKTFKARPFLRPALKEYVAKAKKKNWKI